MTWAYQHLLNAALEATLTLALSYSVGLKLQAQTPTILKGLSLFLNKICIPVMSFWAVGIKLDLTYQGHWKFVGAFLIQTLLFTAVITIWVFLPMFGKKRGKGKEEVWRAKVEVWTEKFGAELVTSSAILGPLALEGALGKDFVPLAFLTALNTIAIQFPTLQIMLQKTAQFNDEETSLIIPQQTPPRENSNQHLDKWDSAKSNVQRKSFDQNFTNQKPELPTIDKINVTDSEISIELQNYGTDLDQNPSTSQIQEFTIEHRSLGHNKKEKNQQIFSLLKEIIVLLIQNPIIWALVAGIIVSVSGLREFLDPESKNFVLYTSWIESGLRALGACLTPIALVVTGLWISKNKIFKSCNAYMVILDLIFKFLVIPVSMIPIAMLLGLRGDEAKASVILSAMPMALVVVPLAQQYNVAVNDFTVNLVLGLILMFPCILALMEIMNHFGWFNV